MQRISPEFKKVKNKHFLKAEHLNEFFSQISNDSKKVCLIFLMGCNFSFAEGLSEELVIEKSRLIIINNVNVIVFYRPHHLQ